MKNLFGDIKDAILGDDDDEDLDAAYEREMREAERRERSSSSSGRTGRSSSSGASRSSSRSRSSYSEPEESYSRERSTRTEKPARSSIAATSINPPRSPESSYSSYRSQPRRTVSRPVTDSSDINLYRAKGFGDSQTICDKITSGSPILVSLEDVTEAERQRIMDFVCGCIYAIEGNIHPVSEKIYLFSPADVDVSGDYVNLAQKDSFGVPTFNKMV